MGRYLVGINFSVLEGAICAEGHHVTIDCMDIPHIKIMCK